MAAFMLVTAEQVQKASLFSDRIILREYDMKRVLATSPVETSGFLLSKIGKAVTDLFGEKVAQIGVRPKHCGLLGVVAGAPAMSQQEIGQSLGLVPSAVVTILDDLRLLDAIRRVDDPDDRRRYSVELTAKGQSLVLRAAQLAQEVDDTILGELSTAERRDFDRTLRKIAAGLGLSRGLDSSRGLGDRKPASERPRKSLRQE